MLICVSKLTLIGSDNSLSPSQRKDIIWTNDGIWMEPQEKTSVISYPKFHFVSASGVSNPQAFPFCSTVGSDTDQRKLQSSASLAFVWGIHWWIPTQKASNAENISMWWRHHDTHPGCFRSRIWYTVTSAECHRHVFPYRFDYHRFK